MPNKINITLQLPNADHPERHFSLSLQPAITFPPCVYRSVRQLFIVANLQGNFRAFYKMLVKHRIIDNYFNWTFGEGHLVVLGNSLDISQPVSAYLWFLYSLEQKARSKGGYVHFILGPHEIAHMNGAWRHEHPPYASALAKARNSYTALYDANFEIRRWLGTRNIVEKIGQFLFVHGNFLPALSREDRVITDTNTAVRSFHTNRSETSSATLLTNLSVEYPLTEKIIVSMLLKYNITTIITGHHAQEQVAATHKGRLITIANNHTTENPVGLLIKRRQLFLTDRKGRKEEINL